MSFCKDAEGWNIATEGEIRRGSDANIFFKFEEGDTNLQCHVMKNSYSTYQRILNWSKIFNVLQNRCNNCVQINIHANCLPSDGSMITVTLTISYHDLAWNSKDFWERHVEQWRHVLGQLCQDLRAASAVLTRWHKLHSIHWWPCDLNCNYIILQSVTSIKHDCINKWLMTDCHHASPCQSIVQAL